MKAGFTQHHYASLPGHVNPYLFAKELEQELENILTYWTGNMIDHECGGFYGRITGENTLDPNSSKGLVLNARICRAFSAAAIFARKPAYLAIAERACHYIVSYFFDREFGGFFWSVDRKGNPVEIKKQVYGLAFCCYAFSEYYQASAEPEALEWARKCFYWIEEYSLDKERSGYVEALSRDWQPLDDLRLSEKDKNEKKTTNTHLHILEAYTNLYRIWPDQVLRERILMLLEIFSLHMIEKNTGHLLLFFDEHWTVKDEMRSYGHEIEASWLIVEAALVVDDTSWNEKAKQMSILLADAALEGVDADGGMWYERVNDRLVKEKHSWPQAEAIIGFFNAWQLTGDPGYLYHSISSWTFVKKHLLDKPFGEWHWGVDADYNVMRQMDKAGFWKCPYHNSRACIEIARRVRIELNA